LTTPTIFGDYTLDDDATSADINPDVIRTIAGEGDPAYVASVLANRKAKSGQSYDQLITEPSQFEARTGDAWDQNSKLAETDPKYKAALAVAGPILTGSAKPVTSADSFYSPNGQKAKGRDNPTWDDGTGVKGPDGQLYFEDKYTPPKNNPGVFGDYETSKSSVTSEALPPVGTREQPTDPIGGGVKVDPNEAAQFAIDSNKSNDKPSWPVYDPYNKVGRNEDGSIAYLGGQDLSPAKLDKDGRPIVTITQNSDPANISLWLKNHPTDIANKGSTVAQTQENGDDLAAGFNTAVGNVKNSIEGGINAVLPGNPLNNDLARGVLNRNTADVNNQGSPVYGAGKFLGETAATAPILAIPGLDAIEGGGVLGQGARFVGGAGGEGSAFLRGVSLASKGALQGGEQAALTSAGSNQSFGNQVTGGAITGSVAAPILHGAGSLLNYAPKVTEVTRDLADKAVNKYGINLNVPLIKNASGVDISPTVIPESKTAELRQQFTNSILKEAQATPEEVAQGPTLDTIHSMLGRTGESMNRFTNGKVVNGSGVSDLADQLSSTRADLDKSEFTGTGGMALKKNIDGILDRISQNGNFTGTDYKQLTASGTPFYRLQNSSDSNVRFYAGKVRDALDNAFESTHNSNEPDFQWGNLADQHDLAQFRADRLNYKKVMTIADAAKETTPDGMIDPSNFSRAVNSRFTNQATMGAGNFGELSDIGKFFLSKNVAPTPQSFFRSHASLGAGLALGEAASFFTHNPAAAAGTLGAGLGAKMLADRLANSPAIRNRMISGVSNTYQPGYLANKFSVPLTVEAARQVQGQ